MNITARFRPRTQSFTAGQEIPVSTAGQFLHILSAADPVQVSIDDGEFITLTQGQGVETNFQKLRIKSATAQSIQWVTGAGRFVDAAANVNVSTSATVAPGNTLDNGGDVSLIAGAGPGATTAIRGADANALTVIIKADAANTETVRIGTTGVNSSQGYPLAPGESVALSTTAAIAGYNPSTTDAQNVHVLPVRDL
jgi:hypothetical protein